MPVRVLTRRLLACAQNTNVSHLKMVQRMTAAVWALGLVTTLTACWYSTDAASHSGQPSHSPRRHRARTSCSQASSAEDEFARLRPIYLPGWQKMRFRFVSIEGAGGVVM